MGYDSRVTSQAHREQIPVLFTHRSFLRMILIELGFKRNDNVIAISLATAVFPFICEMVHHEPIS